MSKKQSGNKQEKEAAKYLDDIISEGITEKGTKLTEQQKTNINNATKILRGQKND